MKDENFVSKTVQLKNLSAINYFSNAFQGNVLPHVFADFSFYRILKNTYPDENRRKNEYNFIRPKNFEWLIVSDTVNNYTKIYDNFFD